MSDHPPPAVADLLGPLSADRAGPLQSGLLAVTAASALVSVLGWAVVGAEQFFFSYLTALIFALTLALGGLFWTLFHHLADAGWSVVIRRSFEHFATAVPWLGLLILPVLLFGMGTLYQWSLTEEFEALPADDEARVLWERKQFYLNKPFFYLRAALYFAVWIYFARKLGELSVRQDDASDAAPTQEAQRLAPAGVLLLGLTSTFAAFDWLMGLDFYWYSTIYGVWFWAASIGGSMAAMILLMLVMRSTGHLAGVVRVDHLHDMGKLVFGFLIFWTYVSFAQYFLIWYANLPEETRFYKLRQVGGWREFGWTLAVGHFVVPFFCLMPRAVKRTPALLGLGAAWMLTFHYLDLYYQVMPNYQVPVHGGLRPHWLDVTCLATTVGVVALVVLRRMRTYPLIPLGDPRLEESIHFHNDTVDN